MMSSSLVACQVAAASDPCECAERGVTIVRREGVVEVEGGGLICGEEASIVGTVEARDETVGCEEGG